MLTKNDSIELESFGLSHIGLGRYNNEDVFSLLPRYHFFALADGMGGHKAGEVAAQEVIFFLTASIEELFLEKCFYWEIEDLSSLLNDLIKKANKWIYYLGTKHKKYEGMGTTICSLLFYKKYLIFGHVGDSRIYRFRKGGLVQLTIDHSLKNETLLQRHNLEKFKGNINNVLTRAIGTSPEVMPDMGIIEVEKEDLFLTCTDGLTDFVDDIAIESFLSQKVSVKNKAEALIEHALANGGLDNITAILIQIK